MTHAQSEAVWNALKDEMHRGEPTKEQLIQWQDSACRAYFDNDFDEFFKHCQLENWYRDSRCEYYSELQHNN